MIDRAYGSRHRAGVGLSAESDCLVVIVSEETGAISFAEYGRLMGPIPHDEFIFELARRLQAAPPQPSRSESGEVPETGTTAA